MTDDLQNIMESVLIISGKDISAYDQEFLMNILIKRWAEIEIDSASEYNLYISKHHEEANHIASMMENQYTEFFRYYTI